MEMYKKYEFSHINSDCVLLCGPIFAGKSNYYWEKYSSTHNYICPSLEYENNPSLGLRDIAVQGIKQLEKGEKVVIDDENSSVKSRDSFINLIKKKVPNAAVSVVELLPEFGCQQLLWARELRAAESSLHADSRANIAGDGAVTRWYEREQDMEVKYTYGVDSYHSLLPGYSLGNVSIKPKIITIAFCEMFLLTIAVEPPRDSEDCHRLKLPLYARSTYKFEVPALFIQWDCLMSLVRDEKLATSKITKILRHWTEVNPCGRVLIVCDGGQIRTGEKIRAQQRQEIINICHQLAASFGDMPLYVTQVDNHGLSGGYVVPPKPGMLAYLQRRHCLNLHSKHTLYLYESQYHMNMAEHAGVRHIKMLRVLEHPSLVVSSHAAVVPPIPDMLKAISFQLTDHMDAAPVIPLYDRQELYRDGHIHVSLGNGRAEFMFSVDLDVVKRYQDMYASHASKITDSGSKMSPSKVTQSVGDDSRTSLPNLSKSVLGTSGGSRDLPKWMLGKTDSGSSASSADLNRTDSTSSTETKVKKTVYVMSEKELTEMAAEIFKQAGKDDLLQQLQSRHDNSEITSGETNKTPNKTQKHKKAKMKAIEQKDQNGPNVSTAYGKYPKMEMEDDYFDNVESFQHTDSNQEAEQTPGSQAELDDGNEMDNSEDNLRHGSRTKWCGRGERDEERDELISDLLEDFDQTNFQRRTSPKKKPRLKPDAIEDIATESHVFNLLENTFNDTVTSTAGRKRPRSKTITKKLNRHPSGNKNIEPGTSDTMDRMFRDVDEKIRKGNLPKTKDIEESIALQKIAPGIKEEPGDQSNTREAPDLSILDFLF